jgi:uncharacterized protein (DUF58 family)
MKVSWEKLIPSLLILVVSFLAARYLGTTYYVLFRAFATLLGLDIILYLISYAGLRYNQHFSAEHLIRGDSIHYDFYLFQALLTTANRIHIDFFPFNNPEMTDLSSLSLTLKARRRASCSYTIQGGTRGIYRVGIKNLLLEDLLGFFALNLPRYNRTFYIYPRLYRGTGYPLKEVTGGGEAILEKSRSIGDNTFSNLREYRPGLSLKTISWKHFARYGFPVIKEQENSVQPGRIIHMDRRTLGDERLREDGVLESTLALIHRILSGGEGVILKGIIPGKSLEITNEATFDSLYQATLSLAFDDPLPPNTSEASEAVTIVSALPDWDLLEESFWQGHSEWQLAAVLEGMEERKREKVVTTIEELQRKGVNITMIDRGDRFWLEK